MNRISILIKKDNPVLPVIGEEIRLGDTLTVYEIKDLRMTVKQLVDYFLLLDSEGIVLKSIKQPYIDSDTRDGKCLLKSLKIIQGANKYHLSENSKGITNSGRKEGSFDESMEAAVLGMYGVNKNTSEIARTFKINRNTVDSHLKRNNLK